MSAPLEGVGGRSQNADTADAGYGGWGVSDKMLTLLTLGVSQKELICISPKIILPHFP